MSYAARCSPHKFGVSVDQPLTFDPACPRCRELLAAGKRTGQEPMPSSNRGRLLRGPIRAHFAEMRGPKR